MYTHSRTRSLARSLTSSLTHSRAHSLTRKRTHSLTHSHTRSLTLSLLHSLRLNLPHFLMTPARNPEHEKSRKKSKVATALSEDGDIDGADHETTRSPRAAHRTTLVAELQKKESGHRQPTGQPWSLRSKRWKIATASREGSYGNGPQTVKVVTDNPPANTGHRAPKERT